MKQELQFERIESPTRRGQSEPVPPRRVTLPGMFGMPLSLQDIAPNSSTVGLPRLDDAAFRGRGRHAAKNR